MATSNGNAVRPQPGSFQEALSGRENDSKHHIAGSLATQTPPTNGRGSPHLRQFHELPSKGFWNDVVTMRWMRRPSSSIKMLGAPVLFWFNWTLVAPHVDNPWRHLLFVSNRLPDSAQGVPMYAKSYWDIAFVAYYVIVFSFIRQSLTIYFLKPLARYYGIKKEGKLDRFAEQGYAIIYFVCSGSLGLWTMYNYLPTWYFRTQYFWIDYPYAHMPGTVKPYYLLQSAYWLQQFLLLVLRIEKPRSDFAELVAHHIVTLWLIGWSYLTNLTPIGNAIFLTMDWSDVFLALSKCFNYLQMEKTKTVAFAWFTGVWTYTRHYLNIVILYSVWTEWDLIPSQSKVWDPMNGLWMPKWVKYQIFIPILLLQFINLFWYFLIWRILLRAIFSSNLDDERSDDEDEDAEPRAKKSKKE
ncbi:hypothetical protein FRC20_011114 [Serendipita sp. 405]|nr:hypothetical protein FRC20_011114 [Serendipita sp. 405]